MLNTSAVGRRVVLRYRRSGAASSPPLTDLVGVLTRLTPTQARILHRSGTEHEIAIASIVAARVVGASNRDILALEAVASRGWLARENVDLDGWLLRADAGWTGRANSVLPLASPRRPMTGLIEECARFYRERGLPLQIQLPLPVRDRLDRQLSLLGWALARPTWVLTAPLETVRARAELGGQAVRQPPDGRKRSPLSLELADQPGQDWLASYRYRGNNLPAGAAELLGRHDRVTFASLRRDGVTVGVARGAVNDGWLGVTAVEVMTTARRQGIASQLLLALSGWAIGTGARECYLQAEQVNSAALAFYTALGFTEHHSYQYRIAPASSGVAARA